LIIGTKRIFAEISEWKVYSIIDINSPFQRENFVLQNIEYKNIYAINEIGWIGISNNKGGYIYPNDYFYVESDPADNILTITTLTSDMLPFIRYKTTDKCIITGKNSFQITYIGEH
jgi:phenylacetate-coenzyme A ligase PaaK-like adenylate-forming protein